MAHATSTFDAMVKEEMEHWRIPGLAISVIHNNEIYSKVSFLCKGSMCITHALVFQGYGVANLSGTPVTGDTLFDCASMSKSFTAAAVGLLVDNDKLYPGVKWSSVVAKLLPEDFKLAEESYTNNITIEDVLCHRTGLPG
jgi:CubicO group peptidase (beta-lactamase class C family)